MSHVIAENLRRVMAQRDIDANELASRLGYSNRATIDHWLSGRRQPTPDSVRRMAEVFGVSVDEIDPAGSAYKPTGPRRKSHGVDNTVEADTIPPSLPTTTTEGQMRDQLRSLEGALSLVPEKHHARFILEVKRLAARMLLQEEEPGEMPGKQKRASGKG